MTRAMHALVGLAAAASFLAPACWAASGTDADLSLDAAVVVVDGAAISGLQFESALAAAIRQKFYHRRPPEDQLVALRREVAEHLIDRVLLAREAQRRGIRADEEQVRAKIADYERRNRDRQEWQESRAQVLPELTHALEQQSMMAQLEAATRVVPPPAEAELRAYYESHPEQFTRPEQLRLSMILAKIDPSTGAVEREQVRKQMADLVKQLENGADFTALARQYSGDKSAVNGGDLGHQHRGMLPQGIETEIDKLAVGAISEPLRLLEGVAIFRVVERKPAQLSKLEDVRRSVAELWARAQGENQWRALTARLRADAKISIGGEIVPAAVGQGAAVGATAAR